MKGARNKSAEQASPVKEEHESNEHVNEQTSVVHNKQRDLLVRQKVLEGVEDPVAGQVAHRVARDPVQVDLLEAGAKVDEEDLEAEQGVVPEGHVRVPDRAIRQRVHRHVAVAVHKEQQKAQDPVQVRVVVPRGFVQEEHVPIDGYESGARQPIPERIEF